MFSGVLSRSHKKDRLHSLRQSRNDENNLSYICTSLADPESLHPSFADLAIKTSEVRIRILPDRPSYGWRVFAEKERRQRVAQDEDKCPTDSMIATIGKRG